MAGSENTNKRKRFDLPGDEKNDEAINDTSMIEADRIMSPVPNVSIFTNILPNDIIYLVCESGTSLAEVIRMPNSC